MRKFWLVVVGTGRCGTKYMSEVLKSAGVNCTHQTFFDVWHIDHMVTHEDMAEKIKKQMVNPWGQEADSSWLSTPFLDSCKLNGMTVVHLVRHPKRTIDSLVKVEVFEEPERYGNFTKFAYEHCPAMWQEPTPKERAARFYVDWNRIIEPWADVRWNVEKNPEILMDRLGIEHNGDLFNNTACNGRTGPFVDTKLEELSEQLRKDVLAITEDYGYVWA